ncbi:MAG TPA: tetratricopeptide repeat protein [Vicinamibacteria bacterium]|nr:tetratricopeptide repeat protein [Vicinamibacteria bacterium]
MRAFLLFFVSLQPVDEAEKYFQAEDWSRAAAAYQEVVESEPENGRAWIRLGISLLSLSRYPEAIAAMEKADGLGFVPPLTRFHLARAEVLAGNRSGALERLESALDAGFSSVSQLESEGAFTDLRNDPRFTALIDRARRNAEPCEHIPEFRVFDFWIGAWEVTSGGQKAGDNRIEKHANGCFLLENWAAVGGSTGKSMNFYDAVQKKWHQVWVDAAGTSIFAAGGLRDGAMHFEGEHRYPNGSSELFRMTFTPREDGTVRQFIEQSKDGGETWYPWFDGLYTRKE